MPAKRRLTPALLRYWRQHRGLSQLDLALSADVSARHVSFLETGRAQPSRDMLLRLSAALRIPLRDAMLSAAGFDDEFPEPDIESELTPAVKNALERMLAQHEPFPMVITDRYYTLRRANHGALRVLSHFVADPSALRGPPNPFRAMFDPRLARPFMLDWAQTARVSLSRLQLEALEYPGDEGMTELIRELLAYPDVPESWKQPDFSQPIDALLPFRLKRDDLQVGFFTTLTKFSTPGNVTLDELKIESYYPLDRETEEVCKRMMQR
jgi:transcriptional regulator with XRE-family HTH domain